MLLQSHAGELHLLPALPPSWTEGEVSGLRGRGGFTVAMKWADGKLTSASLHADEDAQINVRYGEEVKEVKIMKGKTLPLTPPL